ncbi:MAG: rhamnulokinase family protein [Ignavibacteria bacterium]|nr:rhamnulokinase family protein [Ignavibacteria bacterium]
MKESKFIGFDLGAESGRCVVTLINDGEIILKEVHRFKTHTVNYFNSLHWDVLAIYNELLTGLQKAKEQFGTSFDGIGIDTWGVDYVLVDSENRILGYPYHYRDDRTDSMMDDAFKIIAKEELYKNTGIKFAQYNTLFQLLAEKKAKLNLLSVADKMLLMPDFFIFLLTGKKIAELTIASTTSLIDPVSRDWNWQLIDLFGFPRNIFPTIVEPGTFVATISKEIANRIKLDERAPVFASAGHDTACAVESIPAVNSSWAFLSSGTWSIMGIVSEKPIITLESLNYNFSNEGGVQGTTRFLKNIIGLWPLQECKRFWSQRGIDNSYEQLVELAFNFGSANAWIDLNDNRFLKPGDMPLKVVSYLKETNQNFKNDVGFIVRVILESLAFTYKFSIDQLEKVSDKKIDVLHAVGGGIQNELLNQLTADAIGRKVIAGPIEGTTIGNIGMIAVASGAVKNLAEWRSISSRSFPVKEYLPCNEDYFKNSAGAYFSILKNC